MYIICQVAVADHKGILQVFGIKKGEVQVGMYFQMIIIIIQSLQYQKMY